MQASKLVAPCACLLLYGCVLRSRPETTETTATVEASMAVHDEHCIFRVQQISRWRLTSSSVAIAVSDAPRGTYAIVASNGFSPPKWSFDPAKYEGCHEKSERCRISRTSLRTFLDPVLEENYVMDIRDVDVDGTSVELEVADAFAGIFEFVYLGDEAKAPSRISVRANALGREPALEIVDQRESSTDHEASQTK